jgi:sigma-B regulation protein RsbU (phosphoserine phosphatase)
MSIAAGHLPRPAASAPQPGKATINILVIDDSEDSREITEAALMTAGYGGVRGAGSAAEAFAALEIGRRGPGMAVDIILLDIVMPDTDGIEACARIRGDTRYGDVPILMVTSLADMDSLSNAFLAGANDYITKPVNRIELLARVRAALKLKGELERRQERERELLTFLSSWGDRRATLWIDDVTGLFVGEVAEAYLTSASGFTDDDLVSVITLAVDRLDVIRAAQGEEAMRSILARAARAVRGCLANVGVIAAAYRNGLILIVAPDLGAAAAQKLAQTMTDAICALRIINRETIAADHVTASAAVVSGRVKRGADRVQLLTQAISSVQRTSAEGGNRIVALTA